MKWLSEGSAFFSCIFMDRRSGTLLIEIKWELLFQEVTVEHNVCDSTVRVTIPRATFAGVTVNGDTDCVAFQLRAPV